MKRTNYGPGGRPAAAVPSAPKAPRPFNLPSLKSAAGRPEKGAAIAATAAGWATPRAAGANAGADAQNDANDAAMPAAQPPAPAWGGAGVRARAPPGANANIEHPPQRPPPRPRPQPRLDARQDVRRELADVLPPAPPQQEAPVKVLDAPPPVPVTVIGGTVPDDDWAEDDGGELTFSSLALPEVSIEAGPPPVQQVPAPARTGPPRRIPPAAHWQIDSPNHPLGPRRHPQREKPVGGHAVPMPDLREVEKMKSVMKMKAESAGEARRRAEDERLRVQMEGSTRMLRELERRMGVTGQTGAVHANAGKAGRGASANVDNQASAWHNTQGGDVTPKVVLLRPPKKTPPAEPAQAAETVRESGRGRRRNGGRAEQADGGRRPSRDNGRPYDGPRANETREQWLERRRAETEGRDVVRSIIDSCINRAVYGRKSRRRGGERGGRNRRKDGGQKANGARGDGQQKSDASAKSQGASKGDSASGAQPPGAAQQSAAWGDRGRTRSGRTPAPAVAAAGARPVPQPARPAPWAPKPLASPGTATVASVVDAVVGDTDGTSSGSAPSLPTSGSTRRKGGRKRGPKAGDKAKRERGRDGPPKAPVQVASSATAGGASIAPDEAAWSASSNAVKPTNFYAISRAFSNTGDSFSPFVPPMPVIPAPAWPSAPTPTAAVAAPVASGSKWWPPAPVGTPAGQRPAAEPAAPTQNGQNGRSPPSQTGTERPKRGRPKRGGQGRRRQASDPAGANTAGGAAADKAAGTGAGGGGGGRGRRGGRGRKQRDDGPNGGQANGGAATGGVDAAKGGEGQAGGQAAKSAGRRGRSGRGRRGGRGSRGNRSGADGDAAGGAQKTAEVQ